MGYNFCQNVTIAIFKLSPLFAMWYLISPTFLFFLLTFESGHLNPGLILVQMQKK